MSDVYLGEDHYKNIAITEINEAINFCMTNNLSKDKIKKLICFKKNKKILFSRPADIITDVMHYCDHYFDHESLDSKYDFENEFRIAKEYYNDEKLEEETA